MAAQARKSGNGGLSAHLKNATNSMDDSTWIKVESKRRLQRRARPNVLIMTIPSNLTNAEILRKVKAETSLTKLSRDVM